MKKKILIPLSVVVCSIVFVFSVVIATSPDAKFENTEASIPLQSNIIEKTQDSNKPADAAAEIPDFIKKRNEQQQNTAYNQQNYKETDNSNNKSSDKELTFCPSGDENYTAPLSLANKKYTTNDSVSYSYNPADGGTLTIKKSEENEGPEWTFNTVNEETGAPDWQKYISKSKNVIIDSNLKDYPLTTTRSWFSTANAPGGQSVAPHIETITGLGNINMATVTDAAYMFSGVGLLTNLTSVDSFTLTENTTTGHKYLDLTALQDATGMFSCTKGLNVGFGNNPVRFRNNNSANAQLLHTDFMFNNCPDITSVDMDNFDLSAVTSTYRMFRYDQGLTNLTLKKLDFSKITDAKGMFEWSKGLTTIDLSECSGTPKEGSDFSEMFCDCTGLKKVIVAEGTNWTTSSANFTKLFGVEYESSLQIEGCNGTPWDSTKTGNEYARVDNGHTIVAAPDSKPMGYFTASIDKVILPKTTSNDSSDVVMSFVHDDIDHTTDSDVLVFVAPNTDYSSASSVLWHRSFDGNEYYKNVTRLDFSKDFEDHITSYWFDGFTGLQTANILTSKLTNIGRNAFNNCTKLKKVVIGDGESNPSLTDVKVAAFANCTSLENYVVRTKNDGTDSISYANGVFNTAGSTDPTIAAPLIFAGKGGGATETLAKNTLKKPFYTYTELTKDDTAISMSSNNYYYVTNDINLTARAEVTPDTDCVLDLASHTLDRGLKDKDASNDGHSIIVMPSQTSGKTTTLRIDDSFSICKSDVGKIIGANHDGTTSTDLSDAPGGAIFLASWSSDRTNKNSTLNFVNGNINSNKAITEGGGVGVSWYCSMNMYGGYITENTETLSNPTGKHYGGGGVSVRGNGQFIMYGGEITQNEGRYHGGGISINASPDTVCKLFKGKILNNKTHFNDKEGRNCDVFMRMTVDTNKPYKEFIAFDKCEFTMENIGIELWSMHVDSSGNKTATISGSKSGNKTFYDYDVNTHDWQKYFIVQVPQSIKDATNADASVTGIDNGAFAGNQTIKKCVVDIPDDGHFDIGANAFNGASCLETFVIKTTADKNVNYGTGSFVNAGKRNNWYGYKGATESAPLGVAGGQKTKNTAEKEASVFGTAPWRWTFSKLTPNSSGYLTINQLDQYYYYLEDDAYTKDNAALNIGPPTTTTSTTLVIAVLDLNGHKLTRNVGQTAVADGHVIKVNSCNYDTKTSKYTACSTLRLDDTSTLQKSIMGKITGGNGNNSFGGGICTYGNFYMVNGSITDNQEIEGSGITLGNNSWNPGITCLYGGYISGNTGTKSETDRLKQFSPTIMMKTGSKLYVYGGYITDNTSPYDAAGICVYLHSSGYTENTGTHLYVYGGVINNNISWKGTSEENKNTGIFRSYTKYAYVTKGSGIGEPNVVDDGGIDP